MRVFFDTNIYDFIAKSQEEIRVREFLDGQGIFVIATDGNILETLATPNENHRLFQASAIVVVASEYEKTPQSWHQAEEVLAEIQRCRPEWLRFMPSKKLMRRAQYYLEQHQNLWRKIYSLQLPSGMQNTTYYQDSQRGREQILLFQQQLKGAVREQSGRIKLVRADRHDLLVPLDEGEVTIDKFWRYDCLMAWHNAIVRRVPESRDYADWLLPYIQEDAFQRANFTSFWLKDVDPDRITRNRLISLMNYYQMLFKISSGNAEDQNHVSIIPDIDLFMTADKRLFNALSIVIEKHYPRFRKPILVNRNEKSSEVAIRTALKHL